MKIMKLETVQMMCFLIMIAGQIHACKPAPSSSQAQAPSVQKRSKASNLCLGSSLVSINGKTEISFRKSTTDMECSWNMPQTSQNSTHVSVFKVDEAQLSDPKRNCIGSIKFPGQDYRCRIKAGDCIIAYNSDNLICKNSDVVKAVKSRIACGSTVIRMVSNEDISQLSYKSAANTEGSANFKITHSYEAVGCDIRPATVTAGAPSNTTSNDSTTAFINNTISDDFMYMVNANKTVDTDDDEPSSLLEFVIVSALPVLIAIAVAVFCLIRRQSLKSASEHGSTIAVSETQESNISREREANQYVENGYFVEFELQPRDSFIVDDESQPRNSFISYQDSFDLHEDELYTYDNDITEPEKDGNIPVPEKNGYLVPINKDNEGYLVPMDKDEIDDTELDDDAFGDDENPYETIREVFYRSASYSED